MAVSGFEGFEKRLELHFSGDDPKKTQMGLRMIEFESINCVLHAVQCTVVSAVGNCHFDAYVLSESSLFVYPTKIIIKTCGTTQLLKSISPLIHYASLLGFYLSACKYTRGSFIFPASQPYPHTSFKDEVLYIENNLPKSLCYRKASIMPSKFTPSHSWHVFTASDGSNFIDSNSNTNTNSNNMGHYGSYYTVEVCMTDLDQALAMKFFRLLGDKSPGDVAGKGMTKTTGIGEINRRALICDYAFDPCGYSMNGMDNEKYSTIHVTPEAGFSYASFECLGSTRPHDNDDEGASIIEQLKKVVQVFRPGIMSVATSMGANIEPGVWALLAGGLESVGLKLRSCSIDEFPSMETILYQTFTSSRK